MGQQPQCLGYRLEHTGQRSEALNTGASGHRVANHRSRCGYTLGCGSGLRCAALTLGMSASVTSSQAVHIGRNIITLSPKEEATPRQLHLRENRGRSSGRKEGPVLRNPRTRNNECSSSCARLQGHNNQVYRTPVESISGKHNALDQARLLILISGSSCWRTCASTRPPSVFPSCLRT